MAKRNGRFWLAVVAVIAATAVGMKLLGGGVAPVPAAFDRGLTVQQAIQRSSESGKPVIVLATADWCGPCQRYKRGPMSDEAVAALIRERFEPVYLEVDEQAELAAKLGVDSVPAVRVLRPGRPAASLDGYTETDSLLRWLKETAAEVSSAG